MSVTLMTETNLYKDDAIADAVDDASKVATNYLAYNAQDGLTVGRTGQSERAVITSDGMEIYDGQNENIAEFKAVTRLGEVGKANLQLDYHSMQLQDIDGNTYVHFSDLRDDTGSATVEDVFDGKGSTPYGGFYTIRYEPISENDITVFIDGNEISRSRWTISWVQLYIRIDPDASSGSEVKIVYKTADPIRAFTFGNRVTSTNIGFNSFVNGEDLIAGGKCAHAEGSQCSANGDYSHAEGYNCVANGDSCHVEGYNCQCWSPWCHVEGSNNEISYHAMGSHVEGTQCRVEDYYSHAEGKNCTAGNGWGYAIYSHAEGTDTKTYAQSSHAEGTGTLTYTESQHVSGKYNVNGLQANTSLPVSNGPLFVVGIGTSDYDRKDGLVVDRSGNLTIAGTLTQSSDKRLKLHHAYLLDQEQDVTSFVESLKPAYFEKDQSKHLGFYAQDVQISDKWGTMVAEDTNGYLTLGYTEIIAPLVAYVQQQQKKIESLEERIAHLESLINQQ